MEKRAEPMGINEEIKQRIDQEKRLKDLEKTIQQKTAGAPAAGELPPEDYKYVKVESLDELKNRVQRVCQYIEQKEEDVYNKLKFPYRLAVVLGTTAFFLAMVISFFSEQALKVVVKRSVSSFFLFAFLGWLVGLVTNYFSARGESGPAVPDDNPRAYARDVSKVIDDYKKNKELVDKAGRSPQSPVPSEPTSDEKKETIKKVIEQVAKDAPDKVAMVIKGVLSKGEK